MVITNEDNKENSKTHNNYCLYELLNKCVTLCKGGKLLLALITSKV